MLLATTLYHKVMIGITRNVGMLIHINGKPTIGKFNSSLLPESFVKLLDGKKTLWKIPKG